MSVLCEAISVIVPVDVLERKYPGGLEAYKADCPNATFCRDDHLTRIGFMHPDDVRAFAGRVAEKAVLTIHDGAQFVDLAVVDQFDGPSMPCPWLAWDAADGLSRAWRSGSPPGQLTTPTGWSGPTTMKWDLDEAGHVRARVPGGVGFDPEAPGGFIATNAPMESKLSSELSRVSGAGPASSQPAGTEAEFRQRLQARQRVHDAMGALEVCTDWTERDPSSAEAWYELGVTAMTIRRADLAADAWRKAVGLAPTDEKALANLGVAIFEQGRPGEARAWLERAREIDPHDPVALLFLGKSLLTSGDREQARVYLEQALEASRVRRMRDVEVEASDVIEDLHRIDDSSEDRCSSCGALMGWECEDCEVLVCSGCAERPGGSVLCDNCYDTSDDPAAIEDAPGKASVSATAGPPIDAAAPEAAIAMEPSVEQGSGRALVTPAREAHATRSEGRLAGIAAGALFIAYMLSGGLAFLPNHPEITIDATREYLTPQGFSARLNDACSTPPLWLRAFKKEPSEVTLHATNQLGEQATVVFQCKDGHVNPEDQGSLTGP